MIKSWCSRSLGRRADERFENSWAFVGLIQEREWNFREKRKRISTHYFKSVRRTWKAEMNEDLIWWIWIVLSWMTRTDIVRNEWREKKEWGNEGRKL